MRESHSHSVLKPIESLPGVDGTGVQIDNLVDVSQMNNQEVAMRVSTDVDSGQGCNSIETWKMQLTFQLSFSSAV